MSACPELQGQLHQRNLYCLFDLDALPEDELAKLEARATALGDYILAGHLLRDVDGRWGK